MPKKRSPYRCRSPLPATAYCRRMERRGNGASSPVQYGIWEVEGMGLVLTFRGTCSISSALADLLEFVATEIGGPSGGSSKCLHWMFLQQEMQHQAVPRCCLEHSARMPAAFQLVCISCRTYCRA